MSSSGLPSAVILDPANYPYHLSSDPVMQAFDQELLLFVKHITQRVKEAEVERKTVLNLVKEAVRNHCFPANDAYGGPAVNVFGSMQTGIAIDSSDMDILVSGEFGTSRTDLVESMALLRDQLIKHESVHSHNFIDTASVPVLKLDYNITTLEISERHQTFRSMHELSSIMRLLKVDITFEQKAN